MKIKMLFNQEKISILPIVPVLGAYAKSGASVKTSVDTNI